jgi:hypothetical protein
MKLMDKMLNLRFCTGRFIEPATVEPNKASEQDDRRPGMHFEFSLGDIFSLHHR